MMFAYQGSSGNASADLSGGLLPFGALAVFGCWVILRGIRGYRISDFASPGWSRAIHLAGGGLCGVVFLLFLWFMIHQQRAARL